MTHKGERELLRMARNEGVDHPEFTAKRGSHGLLTGDVGGKPFSVQISWSCHVKSKTARHIYKLKIRRAVEAMK